MPSPAKPVPGQQAEDSDAGARPGQATVTGRSGSSMGQWPEPAKWSQVPTTSSRRLELGQSANQPATGTCRVPSPGHGPGGSEHLDS
jgi:hypothetical protein